ncbi:capsular polysaccharide synthesis protein [Actinoplanes subglobosus]|uniref:Capsular polysaccharide synthesis protein n=1 Tax=Actinoplanes subglobosus TaxID=1547892 RepID=A0ABV8IUP5_9ACTN
MTATAPDEWLTRFRAVLRRTPPQQQPVPAPTPPSLLNLAPDPGFRVAPDGVDVPETVSAERAEVPGRPGVTGLKVIVPGRGGAAVTPAGTVPSPGTYTASVSVFLAEPLTGPPPRLAAEWATDEPASARSRPARNEHGHHRLDITFTVPDGARDVRVRLGAGQGAAIWYDFTLTATTAPVRHFDGSTPDDDVYVHEWTGEPDASPSRRTMRATFVPPASAFLPQASAFVAQASGSGAQASGSVAQASAFVGQASGSAQASGFVPLASAFVGQVSGFVPQTPDEVAALRALVAGDPLAAARLALAEGDTGTAVTGLRQVVKAGDPDGEAAWELGRIALTEGRWAAAEQLLRGAVAKRPEAFERGYALALAYDKLKRRDDSRQASAAALAHDTKLPFDGTALLDSDVTSFGARRELGVFLAEHLGQIRTQAEQRLARPVPTTFDQPIFVYWAQGFEAAPPVVRACLAALRANNPDSTVHELTLATIGAYVDVPEDLAAALEGDHYHFSDLLRMLLLEKFGGVWVDATCLVTEPLRPHIDRALAKGSVFAFNYTGPYLVNWFLASRPDSYVMHLWRAASFLWWEKRGEIVDFLLHHHIFEMLYRLDDRFRGEWESGLRLNATPPHALQSVLLRPYDPEMFQTITEGAFVHKLRHQLPSGFGGSESYLARIIRGDH